MGVMFVTFLHRLLNRVKPTDRRFELLRNRSTPVGDTDTDTDGEVAVC